jgi:hypothetical protein
MKFDIYCIAALGKSGLQKSQFAILEYFQSVTTVIGPLKPSGNFMFLTIYSLQNINTASQRLCVFHMTIRTERKYFPIQQ